MIQSIGDVTTITPIQTSQTSKKASQTTFDEVLQTYQSSNVQIGDDYDSTIVDTILSQEQESETIEVTQASVNSRATTSSNLVPMSDIFQSASEKYNVPYNLLVAVARAESNFQTSCTSKSGAMGVMQLMPATAKYLGVMLRTSLL